MNRQEFNQVGGFPMTTRVLDELQKAFSVFNGLGGLSGDMTIISGCVTVGSTVSNGVVYVNGEVLEFRGGLAQTNVIIKEDVENLTFQNGNSNPVIKTRYVTFGTGLGAMDWKDFKKPVETKQISSLIQRIEELEARPLVGNIPIGLIALWGQVANLIPDGWVEYTEMNGRFPVGFNAADTDFDVVGKTGGAKTKTLSIAEMPPHDHPLSSVNRHTGNNSGHPLSFFDQGAGGLSTVKTDNAGGGQAFSIMNPFRVVHFIKYVGV